MKRHQETGLRILAALLLLTAVLLVLLAVQQATRQRGASVEGLFYAFALALSPAISAWLVLKLATGLEWLADIKRKLDS